MATKLQGRRSGATDRQAVSNRPGDRRWPEDPDGVGDISRGRRNQILAAATRLFAEYGFETTSTRQIANEVDIIAGSIYHHFSTKEEILHEIIRQTLEMWAKNCIYIRDMPVDSELRIISLILKNFSDLVSNWEIHAIITQESQFLRRTKDFSYVSKIKLENFRVQEAILKDGIEAGLFQPDIDIYLMIGTISRMLTSAAAWFRRGDIFCSDTPERYTFDTVVDFHLNTILRMVRTPARLENPIPREFCERLVDLSPRGRP